MDGDKRKRESFGREFGDGRVVGRPVLAPLPFGRERRPAFVEYVLPYILLLNPYKFFGVSASFIALSIVVVLKLLHGGARFRKSYLPYLLFFFYLIFRDVAHIFLSTGESVSGQVYRLLEYSSLCVLLFLTCDRFNEDVLYKSWKIAGTIFGAGLLYHALQAYAFGGAVRPISVIPGYELAASRVDRFSRPSSFFTEPAAFADAMTPLLFLALKRQNLAWAVATTLLILTSTSTCGVVLSAILWFWRLLSAKIAGTQKMALTIGALALGALFARSAFFTDSRDKAQNVFYGQSTFGSRIKVPFEVVAAMDWTQLVLGSDQLNAADFILENRAKFQPDSSALVYADSADRDDVFLNTAAQLTFRYGVVGFVLFLGTFYGKVFNRRYEAREYAIMILIAIFAKGSLQFAFHVHVFLLLYANKATDGASDVALTKR